MEEIFLESIRGLIGVKIGLFHLNNQFTEGTLLDVQNDHLVVQVGEEDIFYFALDQIKAISKDTKAKKKNIDNSELNAELAESLDEILKELQYNWVTINNFNNQIFSGVLSKIASDYVVLADNQIHFFIQKAHISNVYKGQYEQQNEEENNNNNSDSNSEDSNSNNSNSSNSNSNAEVSNSNEDVATNQDVATEDPTVVELQDTTNENVTEETVTELQDTTNTDIDNNEIVTEEMQVMNSEDNNKEISLDQTEPVVTYENTNSSPNTMPTLDFLNHLYTFTSLKHNDPLGSTGNMKRKNNRNCKRKKVKSGLDSYTRFRNLRNNSTLNVSTSQTEEIQETSNLLDTNNLSPAINLEDQNKLIESQYYALMNFASKMADSQSQYLSLKRHAEKMHSQLKDERLINH